MKPVRMFSLIVISIFLLRPLSSAAQTQEVQQLLLNLEKLAQLKSILENMYKGYKVIDQGYSTIKNLSEGNFKLHQVFLDGLMSVSPLVKNYKRITDIIIYQKRILMECQNGIKIMNAKTGFTPQEKEYMKTVYEKFISKSLKNLDELALIIAAGKLRMNDAERLSAIDRIFEGIEEQFLTLRSFNNQTTLLSLQREKEKVEIDLTRNLYNLP